MLSLAENVSRESKPARKNWQGGHCADWTDERVQLLKRLWNEGLSASQIAREPGGLTRGAICGKIHRMGLPARRLAFVRVRGLNSVKRERKPRPLAWNSPDAVAARKAIAAKRRDDLDSIEVVELTAEQSATAVPFMQLGPNTCRWPLGDPRDLSAMRFCGAAPAGGPYCVHHHRMAYVKPEKKIYVPKGY